MRIKGYASPIIGIIVLGIVVFAAWFAVTNRQTGDRQEAQQRAIERAAVLCYALEGGYPPDVSYLEEHYGLVLDRDKYIIHYSTFGSNIRPEITVFAYE